MKAILLCAKDAGEIRSVTMADFSDLGTGQAIAAPGALAHVLTNTGRLVPVSVQLIQIRS